MNTSPAHNMRANNDAILGRNHPEHAASPYWDSKSILVEYLSPERDSDSPKTLCGALLRLQPDPADEEHELRTWTCGGIIHVNGKPYGLATAHSLFLQSKSETGTEGLDKSKVESRPSIYDVLVQDHDFDSLGLVGNYAMSRIGFVPANNDWLLIDIPEDIVLPNIPAQPQDEAKSWSICSWRGALPAELRPGPHFLLPGNSPFKVSKFVLEQQIEPGDSGAWVMEGDDVLEVVIAGGRDESGAVAYAINMNDMCRSISIGINGAEVRLPTSTENAILAHIRAHGDQASAELVALYINNLVRKVATEGSPTITLSKADGLQAPIESFGSLLQLARMCLLRRSWVREPERTSILDTLRHPSRYLSLGFPLLETDVVSQIGQI